MLRTESRGMLQFEDTLLRDPRRKKGFKHINSHFPLSHHPNRICCNLRKNELEEKCPPAKPTFLLMEEHRTTEDGAVEEFPSEATWKRRHCLSFCSVPRTIRFNRRGNPSRATQGSSQKTNTDSKETCCTKEQRITLQTLCKSHGKKE